MQLQNKCYKLDVVLICSITLQHWQLICNISHYKKATLKPQEKIDLKKLGTGRSQKDKDMHLGWKWIHRGRKSQEGELSKLPEQAPHTVAILRPLYFA